MRRSSWLLTRVSVAVTLAIAGSQRASAQQGFTDAFPPEEFSARRAKVMTSIGDGVAVLQGTTERRGESPLRQSNQFFYLTCVVEPRAMLIIDGRARTSTLFLMPRTAARQRAVGPYLDVGDSSAKVTGLDAIVPRDSFSTAISRLAADRRVIFTPLRPEVLGSESAGDVQAHVRTTKTDPWDGHTTREEAFIAHLKEAAPQSEVRDLDPIIDTLRAVKSPREIALIREATRLAGLAIMEVMRDAEPGMYEYELEAAAEYVYKRGGAYGESYFPLIADGRNMPYTHYHKNRARLVAGDLVQFDWAPDIANYTTDVTRVFPANGKFTPRQREFYTIYLRLYQALMSSIRVHVTAREITDSAVVKMERIMGTFSFSDPRIRATAEAFVNRFRRNPNTPKRGGGSLGHSVGMEVHDVRNPTATLEPGYVFTIEPQMTMDGGELSVRLEDMILMTESGYENLSAFVPVEIDEIERLMAQPGLGAQRLQLPAPAPANTQLLDADDEALRAMVTAAPRLAFEAAPLAVTPNAPDFALGMVSWVTSDNDGTTYLLQRGDKADPIIAVDRNGKVLRSWGKGLYVMPHAIRVDRDGNVWTTDAASSHVIKFSPQGKALLDIAVGGQPTPCPNNFCGTTDVAFAANGHVFVSDGYANARVLEYTADGRKLLEWGTAGTRPGQFKLPHSIQIDAAGIVYVADRENGRVQRFDQTGKFLGEWKYGRTFGLEADGAFMWLATQPVKQPNLSPGWLLEVDTKTGQIAGWVPSTGNHGMDVTTSHELLVGPVPSRVPQRYRRAP